MAVILRVRLIGSGTDADPFRVNLPTYQMIDVDYAAQLATVEVPEADLPDGFAEWPGKRVARRGRHQVVTRMPKELRQLSEEHLRRRYVEAKRDFKVDVED